MHLFVKRKRLGICVNSIGTVKLEISASNEPFSDECFLLDFPLETNFSLSEEGDYLSSEMWKCPKFSKFFKNFKLFLKLMRREIFSSQPSDSDYKISFFLSILNLNISGIIRQTLKKSHKVWYSYSNLRITLMLETGLKLTCLPT